MKILELLVETITPNVFDEILNAANKLWKRTNVRISFGSHFTDDRINDPRNNSEITQAELIRAMKQIHKLYKNDIIADNTGGHYTFVYEDPIKGNINLPASLKVGPNEKVLVFVSAYRKPPGVPYFISRRDANTNVTKIIPSR